MIPATLSVEKVFQLFRTFPMRREQRSSGRISLAEHERQVIRIPIRAAGGVITREAGPVKGGNTIIAFVQDPDGYKVELIQNGTRG